MAIEAHDVEFLAEARRLGVDFRATLTIGRQALKLGADGVASLVGQPRAGMAEDDWRYAEPLFRTLGAETVDSLDASDFEGATLVHDLNDAVDAAWHGRFTAVYDGGTLEHVFNFPVAIRSCMEMVAPGGHLILQSPANNQCGHGFYQFSPELFYRVLSPENGFAVERMIAYELHTGRRFAVTDPATIGARVELTNSRPVLLLVQARRTAVAPALERHPQQSDYAALWEDQGSRGTDAEGGAGGRRPRWFQSALGRMSRRHPAWTRRARRLYVALGGRADSAPDLRNRRFFQPVEPPER